MVLGRLKLVPEGVELRPWRSLEVRGSPELQNGGLRALEDAWDDFLLEAFSCQKSARSLCFWVVPSWFQKEEEEEEEEVEEEEDEEEEVQE